MKLINTFVLLLFCCSTAEAIDLAEMQKMALGNRQVVEQYVTRLAKSEEDITLAKAPYLPSVDIAYTVNTLNEDGTYENEQNSIVYGSVSYNIFAGFRDKYNIESAEMLRAVEAYSLEGIQQDLQLSVALAYLAVYERLANKKVAQSAFETLGRVYRDGESRFQVGLIGKNELLKFRVDYDNADITLKGADAGLKKSVNVLSRQVGSRIELSDLNFSEFEELPTLMDKDAYTVSMLETRSEIKALETLIGVSETQAKSEKSGYYPKLDLVGSYTLYDDDYVSGNGSYDDDELRAQLVLSMNLFRGYATQASVTKAKLSARATRYELEELKDNFTTDLDNLFIDFQVSLENVNVANRSIEQAEENLRITQLKYDEGLQRESDLLDAITSLSRAQYNYVTVLKTAFSNNFQLTRMVDGF
ncbi:TolC family protein [Desulforhopalus sp. IMCC35007]|uniref:TolC family protein n=1 Tax=Desulforhopalus sp. IMCC35007 TaxID=2569543 RepID=UPI0010AEE097|nr:TolC family protein [Desulforhopalus sp. IMCC35007]TKB08660.1 TolC family protein [Desulforhopalus sp. IMCC35007]